MALVAALGAARRLVVIDREQLQLERLFLLVELDQPPHKLVAPPLYVMLCSSLDKAQGIKLLTDAIDLMREEIQAAKGELQIKSAPRAVDERDDKLLSNLMSTLEQQNQEVVLRELCTRARSLK